MLCYHQCIACPLCRGDSCNPSSLPQRMCYFSRIAIYVDSSSPSPPSTPPLSSSPPRTPSPPRPPPPHLLPFGFTIIQGSFPPDPPPSPPASPVPRPLPAPNQMVELLPLKVYAKSKCSARYQICLEDYKKGDTIKKLHCLHEFHRECVYIWLMGYTKACPLCRGGSCNPSPLPASSKKGYDGDIDKTPPSSEEDAKDGDSPPTF